MAKHVKEEPGEEMTRQDIGMFADLHAEYKKKMCVCVCIMSVCCICCVNVRVCVCCVRVLCVCVVTVMCPCAGSGRGTVKRLLLRLLCL